MYLMYWCICLLRLVEKAVHQGDLEGADIAAKEWLSNVPYEKLHRIRAMAEQQIERTEGPLQLLQGVANALRESAQDIASRVDNLKSCVMVPTHKQLAVANAVKEGYKKDPYSRVGAMFQAVVDIVQPITSLQNELPLAKLPAGPDVGSDDPMEEDGESTADPSTVSIMHSDPSAYMQEGLGLILERLHIDEFSVVSRRVKIWRHSLR
ncbi:hypothetical protein CEUSTIGMA_g13757.t1 [Chlamydomonas eustigma]|uniref:Vinculin n=1 Tax=Chlamydomonas eustigma TaxID=1157962 RepID=A0A250XTF8_9CHLO|nr:hypothetical protein CEUSTIGMA_g13757.t1 [Chlamydomonas eustigma]|eukprot:GAX86345.1 hypothetical protein CEUSTIGMA_g13757.t1 [Chlamydomonas eustigma]